MLVVEHIGSTEGRSGNLDFGFIQSTHGRGEQDNLGREDTREDGLQ